MNSGPIAPTCWPTVAATARLETLVCPRSAFPASNRTDPLTALTDSRFIRALCLAGACLGSVTAPLPARAQNGMGEPGSIYTCVDAQGRTLTSDRLIAACSDREQRELSPSGATRRIIEPAWTAEELAAREARRREAQEVAQRLREERRRDRALLARYPNLATHERERKEALKQVDAVLDAASQRIGELAKTRRQLDSEMEFYARDPSKAPASLQRQRADNDHAAAVQRRFVEEQQAEKRRVDARFDEQLERLRKLWGPQAATRRP